MRTARSMNFDFKYVWFSLAVSADQIRLKRFWWSTHVYLKNIPVQCLQIYELNFSMKPKIFIHETSKTTKRRDKWTVFECNWRMEWTLLRKVYWNDHALHLLTLSPIIDLFILILLYWCVYINCIQHTKRYSCDFEDDCVMLKGITDHSHM